VAVNDLLLLGLYLPIVSLLLGLTDIPPPYGLIGISVALFLVAPLAAAAATRALLLRRPGGGARLARLIAVLRNTTAAGLLATLVLVFVLQGRTIGRRPLHMLLIMLPLLCQTALIFGATYAAGFALRLPHEFCAPAALIATSNFFELSVAVAISVFGADSGAALATVVGVLVEVPCMLALVGVCRRLRPRLDARVAAARRPLPPGSVEALSPL